MARSQLRRGLALCTQSLRSRWGNLAVNKGTQCVASCASPVQSPSKTTTRTIFKSSLPTPGNVLRMVTGGAPEVLKHHERKITSVPAPVLFNVILDVDSYKQFLPWCLESKVLSRKGNTMKAELKVGFGPFTEHYVSDITFIEPKKIDVKVRNSLVLKYLNTTWELSPQGKNTLVKLDSDFQFHNAIHQTFAQNFLDLVVKKMASAFEAQGQRLQRKYQLDQARQKKAI
eukprot:TRINITY_DN17936_c0_g1_i1.p1 TRINITY_DN17936_c0_g1~~TRINITY_DN17936_c0_g1_i1.p1  ORF type:complete len:229 (+),score=23.46 TRINITY_DN17936_c0_g1_i1:107-793(+)